MPPQIKASLQGKVHTRDNQEACAAQTRTSTSHLIHTWIKPLTGGWNKDTVLLIQAVELDRPVFSTNLGMNFSHL